MHFSVILSTYQRPILGLVTRSWEADSQFTTQIRLKPGPN